MPLQERHRRARTPAPIAHDEDAGTVLSISRVLTGT